MQGLTIWIGLGCLALAGTLFFLAFRRRSRALAVRAAARRTEADERAALSPNIAIMRDVAPGLINLFLGFIGLKTFLMWLAMDRGAIFSVIDITGLLALLAAYGTWFTMRTRYSDLVFKTVPQPKRAQAPDDAPHREAA